MGKDYTWEGDQQVVRISNDKLCSCDWYPKYRTSAYAILETTKESKNETY